MPDSPFAPGRRHMDLHRAAAVGVALSVAALIVVPIGIDFVARGVDGLFAYAAADSFYYLTVAANYSENHIFTFDQQYPTNGFHPLWQWLLAIQFPITQGADDPRQAFFVMVLIECVVLLGLGLGLLAWACARHTPQVAVLYLGLPVGVYGLFAGTFEPRTSTLWACVNGMESALMVCVFGALARWLLVDREVSRRPWAALGLAMGAMALSRLDTVFFVPAFLIVTVAEAPRNRSLWRGAVKAALLTAAIVLLYMVFTRLTAGTFLPVSGKLKSSFPQLNDSCLNYLVLVFQGRLDPAMAGILIVKLAQVFIPLGVIIADLCAEILIAGIKARASVRGWLAAMFGTPWRRFLMMGRLFVLFFHLYNVAFVELWHQGYWYFPLSQIILTLLVIDRLCQAVRWGSNWTGSLVLRGAVAVTLVVYQVMWFQWHIHCGERNYYYWTLYHNRDAIRERYVGASPKLVSLHDGIVAYWTGFPTMSGLGLCLDKEGFEAFEQGRLLELACQRGYDRLVTIALAESLQLSLDSPPERVVAALVADDTHLYALSQHRLDGLTFHLDSLVKEAQCAISRFEITPDP